MSNRDLAVHAACRCGSVDVKVNLADTQPSICQCYVCRHSTGQLYSSYYRLEGGPTEIVPGEPAFTCYKSRSDSFSSCGGRTAGNDSTPSHPPSTQLYSCRKCGCHVFRMVLGGDGDEFWEVASGVVDEVVPEKADSTANKTDTAAHGSGADDQTPILHLPGLNNSSLTSETSSQPQRSSSFINASCLCGQARFHITRPDEKSRTPKSYFPDLMIPYRDKDPLVHNPDDVKWWLRRGQDNSTSSKDSDSNHDNYTRYLAGLCACRSCRLTSGFELQSWTFVPRTNIFFPPHSTHNTSSSSDISPTVENSWVEAEFGDLHDRGVIKGYASSDGVTREFCPGCGATVFWHDTTRPELIDVSVGLFEWGDGGEEIANGLGSWLGSWLDWWTERVSFAEESALERSGKPMANAVAIVDENERRLKALGHSKRV